MHEGNKARGRESSRKTNARGAAPLRLTAIAAASVAMGLAPVGSSPVDVRAATDGTLARNDGMRAAAQLDLAGADPAPAAGSIPKPRLKPLERDRSDQVIAVLARSSDAQEPAAAAGRARPVPPKVELKPLLATAPANEAIEQLRDELQARDQVIADLLARVEQLERRIVLADNQLDQAVAGAGPMPPLPRSGAEPVPPTAADSVAPDAGSAPPAQMAQAQPPRASEEPAAPAQAPGEVEIDEAAIDRALERTLVQEGALLLPFGQAEIEPRFTYTRREIDAPTFVTVNGNTFVGEQDIDRNEFEGAATLRVGLPLDAQVEVGIPYNYVDESVTTKVANTPQTSNSESGHGVGDLSVGLAKTLLREGAGWWPDVIARVTWDADTGKTQDNGVFLGSGFNELSGSLSAVKRQDPLAFVGSVSYTKAFENDDFEPGDEVGFSLGTVLAASPETSLSFFFNQTFTDDVKFDGDRLNGSDQVIGTFSMGAATILGRNVLLSITGEVGLTDDAPDYAIGASLPIRFDLPTF